MKSLQIKNGKFNNLSIADDKDVNNKIVAVLLHIPDTDKFNHSHIKLSKKEAKNLRDWLTKFLR